MRRPTRFSASPSLNLSGTGLLLFKTMNATKQFAWWLVGLTAPLLLPAAQTTYTVPVGALSVTINGGSVAAPTNTSFAIPLLDSPPARASREFLPSPPRPSR
jgi:hypothetical protein